MPSDSFILNLAAQNLKSEVLSPFFLHLISYLC